MAMIDATSREVLMVGARGPYRGAFLDNSFTEEQAGYPKAKEVLAGMGDRMLDRERASLLRASFDRMFGHNARKMLKLIEDEIAVRGDAFTVRSIFTA